MGWDLESFSRSIGGQSPATIRAYVTDVDAFAHWAARAGVEMPLSAMVYRVLYESLPAKEAVRALMSRPIKAEVD